MKNYNIIDGKLVLIEGVKRKEVSEMRKHLFLICRTHNRIFYNETWMDVYPFIKLFIETNIRNGECQITETSCDLCKDELLQGKRHFSSCPE